MFLTVDEINTTASLKSKLGTDDQVQNYIIDAMDIAHNYLHVLYDCDKAFETIGNNRNKLLLRHIKSIVKYMMYETSAIDMNATVDNNYAEAIKWLLDAGNGTIPTTLPTHTDEAGEEELFMFLGGKKKYKTDN
jgi:phage gp36-like protein